MSQVEKTVFISYRRINLPWALFIYQNLTNNGFDVFFDYLSISSGDFEKVILGNIKARAHFIVILTPSALERCDESGDWLRREIEIAIDEKRNIVPLMVESFDFDSPNVKEKLIGKLACLKKFNGLRIPSDYALEAMERLRSRYLDIALSDVELPELQTEAHEITLKQINAAKEAASVKEDQLSIQEWFERGYVFQQNNNFDEALRCYRKFFELESDNRRKALVLNNIGSLYSASSFYEEAISEYRKAIELDPKYVYPHYGLGDVYHRGQGKLEEAIAEYRKAIEIDPKFAHPHCGLGNVYRGQGKPEEAISEYRKAIELDPKFVYPHIGLGNVYRSQGKPEEAMAEYREAIELDTKSAFAYTGIGLLLSEKGNYKDALEYHLKAVDFDPNHLMHRASLANCYLRLGFESEYKNQTDIIRPKIRKENIYNQACLYAVCNEIDLSLSLLEEALKKQEISKDFAKNDPDFNCVRNDPRFKKILGSDK